MAASQELEDHVISGLVGGFKEISKSTDDEATMDFLSILMGNELGNDMRDKVLCTMKGYKKEKIEESPGLRVVRIMRYMGHENYLRIMAEISKLIYQEQCLAVLRVIYNTIKDTNRQFEINMHHNENRYIIEVKETKEEIRDFDGISINCINDKKDRMLDIFVSNDYISKCIITEVQLLELEFIINKLLDADTCCLELDNGNIAELITKQYKLII